MFKKQLVINLFLLIVFLFSAVFPADLFSYEKKSGWVDESIGYKPVMYKKVRCFRCGMEFFYIPGKESPHAHWVHYELSEYQTNAIQIQYEDNKEDNTGQGLTLDDNDMADVFHASANELIQEQGAKRIIGNIQGNDLTKSGEQMPLSVFTGSNLAPKYYELRQKLTCPYDGYSFLSDSDNEGMIEEHKLMNMPYESEGFSTIEQSFTKSIPFGVSKDLKQFGYDLFITAKADREKEESKQGLDTRGVNNLAGLSLIQAAAAFSPQGQSLKFPAEDNFGTAVVPIDNDYIVGPGDKLVINTWGSAQESFPVEVDREGKIILPKAGPFYVWGMKFGDVEQKITAKLNEFYTNFKVDVSMAELRKIKVDVVGEVKSPGAYTLGAQAGIFQVLYQAEGPTKTGSLRKIKVIHADGKEEIVDLYPFLLEGAGMKSVRIQSGDTIFVPAIGDVVAIAGNVKRPGIYEIKSNIPLGELFEFAGGITPTGDLQHIQVERVQDNEKRVMIDIELERLDKNNFSFKGIDLQNGDMVMVSPIVRLKHNFVTILGNVERPGDYALTNDMKVSGLIEKAKGFLPGTYLSRVEIARVTKNRTRRVIPVDMDNDAGKNMVLGEWDVLLVYSEAEVNPPTYVEIDGAVTRPGKYELTPDMKTSDLIFKAGRLSPGKVIRGAELFHMMPGEKPVVRDIKLTLLSEASFVLDKDLFLCSGDSLFIKSEPKFTERQVISVKGEIKYPGAYSIREGERLSSLIERAGDFTEEAFLAGAVFTRKSIKEVQENMREQFIQKENRTLLEEQQSVLLRKSATVDSAGISESFKIRKNMLDVIKSADIKGRMVIKLMPVTELKGSKYDILLEDGDSITMPQTPSTITVIGSVNNPTSVSFEQDRGLDYYLQRTGGFTKHADKAGVYVIKANGEAVGKFMMSKKIEQGDTIIVPQEFKYWTPPGQLLRDTVEMLSRIAVGVGVIAALQ